MGPSNSSYLSIFQIHDYGRKSNIVWNLDVA